MIDSGIERDNIHYNVSEDLGYGSVPIITILSAREPGKSTSILLDVCYSAFKKHGLPFVYLVNHAIDINESLLASFETQINSFKGYEIHTKYPKSAKETVTVVKEKETDKPFCYIIPFSAPKTRLKRLVLGQISCIWYDECNIDPTTNEKWPDNIGSKFLELYTTLARKSYPRKLRAFLSGNLYTKYNPILITLGVDCNKLEIGRKLLTKRIVNVEGTEIDCSVLVNCYQMKPELKTFILQHNPAYHFDETYRAYFDGKAIADISLPLEETRPDNYQLAYCFKISSRYLWVWRNYNSPNDAKYWLEAKGEPCGKRKNTFVVNICDLMSNSFLAKPFKQVFIRLQFAMATMSLSFQSPEAFYLMQQVSSVI